MKKIYDFIIIGAGVAGSYLAIKLSKIGSVALFDTGEPSSSLAQGGIAAVSPKNPTDTYISHIEDTMRAGSFVNDEKIVRLVVERSYDEIQQLEEIGVAFADDLHIEGGHSHRRIFHSQDGTGARVMESLMSSIGQGVDFHRCTKVVNLLAESGVVLGCEAIIDREICQIFATNIILTTGGASGIYEISTNRHSGEGMYLAHLVGAQLEGLEFQQFHPTGFTRRDGKVLLISEALRGEGARLSYDGKSFLPSGVSELSPRDILAREIFLFLDRENLSCVQLDATHISDIEKKFPDIHASLLSEGVDMRYQPIPVSPVAHYSCGGVVVNEYGETRVKNLFCIGEAASTGLHGANRLASNSLAECLVMASSCFDYISRHLGQARSIECEKLIFSEKFDDMAIGIQAQLKSIMWKKCGLVKSDNGLKEAQEQIASLARFLEQISVVSEEIARVRSMVFLATETIVASLRREHSLGCYYNVDRPKLI